MKVEHFIHNQYKQSTWSGGKTTELFIFPPESDYQKRTFDYRISSATIEQQYSKFTLLSGYYRLLMPLEKSVTLTHGEKKMKLETYEVGELDGEIPTTSEGKCTDFNLIYKKSMRGEMKLLQADNSLYSIEKDSYLYCIDECVVKVNGITYSLNRYDSLLFTKITEQTILELLTKDDAVKLIYVSCT